MKNKSKNHEQSQLHSRLSRLHGRGLGRLASMSSCSVEKQISISTITIEFLFIYIYIYIYLWLQSLQSIIKSPNFGIAHDQAIKFPV